MEAGGGGVRGGGGGVSGMGGGGVAGVYMMNPGITRICAVKRRKENKVAGGKDGELYKIHWFCRGADSRKSEFGAERKGGLLRSVLGEQEELPARERRPREDAGTLRPALLKEEGGRGRGKMGTRAKGVDGHQARQRGVHRGGKLRGCGVV